MASLAQKKAVENSGGLDSTVVASMILGSLILSFFLGGPLERVWSLYESLQIVQLIRLFDTRTPGNVSSFTQFFEDITGAKFAETWLTENFYIPEQTPFSLNFQNAGYDNALFIANA